MIKVIYKKDALSGQSLIEECETLGKWLTSRYSQMPEHLRIFHSYSNTDCAEISVANECTPANETDLKKLDLLPGTFIVIENPKGWPAIIAAVVSLVIAVATYFLMPTPTIAATNQNNQSAASPNNELSSRQNRTRINQRVPDIYGEGWSTPDLIVVPYTIYENNIEVEHLTAVIGRGHYLIKDAFDGDTRIVDISGATVQAYRPGINIESGAAYYQVGSPITGRPLAVQRQTSANGQVLRPSNTKSITGAGNIAFAYPNEIVASESSNIDFTESFTSNDTISLSNASFISDTVALSLDGTYKVLSVSTKRITLSNPAQLNTAWNAIAELSEQITDYSSPNISSINEKWIGPFILDNTDRSMIMANFVAQNGLYKANGTSQTAVEVIIEIEVTPVDLDDVPTGAPIIQSITLRGSRTARETIGTTLKINTFPGRCSVRARRVTTTDTGYSGTVVDDVKWAALYGASPMKRVIYDNCTVVRARTYATTGALSVKERKLNMLVQRELPIYQDGAMTTELHPTSSYADALVSLATDPKIGRLSLADLDLENIYNTQADVIAYFGTEQAAQFCTTLDDSNMSFEEIAVTIADACFLTIYRQGNLLQTFFERKNENSSLLFNFRNKVPNTHDRSYNFGIADEYDGLVYEWTDPKDDSRVNIYLPDKNAKNPKEIKSLGVRNKWQARFNAYRLWNKLKFQNKTITFEACAESELLILKDRVLYSHAQDQQKFQNGEIEAQDGLILHLSHPVVFKEGTDHIIYLQLPDGTVDSIGVVAGEDKYHVVIQRMPLKPLAISYRNQVRTVFTIVPNDHAKQLAYLVVERAPADVNTNKVTLVNYDNRYYQNDKDFFAEPEVDQTPLKLSYDMLDINLANLWKIQRGDLPTAGDVYFEVAAGVLISSSSAYRPEITNYYRLKAGYSILTTLHAETNEIPAITVGDWPSTVNIYLTVFGTVCGRGGDGAVAQEGLGWATDIPGLAAEVATRRDGYAGAPGIHNTHANFHLLIDKGIVARGGSGGGASPAGYSTYTSTAAAGACGAGGQPFGGVLSGENYEYMQGTTVEIYAYAYSLLVHKKAFASKAAPGQGYQSTLGASNGYTTGTSGDGGIIGGRGTASINNGYGYFQPYTLEQGQPGPGGLAITGLPPASTQLLNGGQILQTI